MMTLIDLVGTAAAVQAAYDTGLLEALVERMATAEVFAAELGIDRDATRLVLDLLTAAGYVHRLEDGGVTASPELRDTRHRMPLGFDGIMAIWRQVPEFLRSGALLRRMDGPAAERSAEYRDVVGELARLFIPNARQLARGLDARPLRILDVGAGAGIWSLMLAQEHPDATVTAVDFPDVLTSFERTAASMGLDDRIAVIPGDAFAVDLPVASFDVIVLANILHLEPAERAAALVHRVADALDADGRIVIVDVFGGDGSAEFSRSIYALHLALRTERGVAHRLEAMEEWLRLAGFRRTDYIPLDDPLAGGMGALVVQRATAGETVAAAAD